MGQQGKKYSNIQREQILADYLTEGSITAIARRYSMSSNTIYEWLRKGEEDGTLQKLRDEKKREFINVAWSTIGKGAELINRRVARALENESELDKLIDEIMDNTDISAEEKKAAVKKITAMKLEDITKISTAMGTLYDKAALANNEATQRIDGNLNITKFEDL